MNIAVKRLQKRSSKQIYQSICIYISRYVWPSVVDDNVKKKFRVPKSVYVWLCLCVHPRA